MIFFSLAYVVAKWRKWKFTESRWFRWLIVLGGPLTVIAIETGWWYAEVGRQPWILYGLMRTAEAATTSGGVQLLFIVFSILYIVLGIGCVAVLLRMFKNNPIEKELSSRTDGDHL